MKYSDLLILFETYLKANNLSELTITQYKKEMKYFFGFMEEKEVTNIKDIQLFHIDLYNAHLLEIGNSPSTRSKKYSVLRKFFKFCQTRNYIPEDPMNSVDPIKQTEVDEKKREVLTIEETIKLINRTVKNSIYKEKNKCILKIFLYCGLRVSELCDIRVEDVNFKDKYLQVRKGKGRKPRKVPLFDDVIKDLKEYLKKRQVESEYLFTTKRTERPMKPRAVHALIKDHVARAKIDKNIGPHSLRRTSATNYLRNGVSERYIQIYLGHKNITTTMKYMNPEIEEVMDELRRKNVLQKKLKQSTDKNNKKKE